MAFNQRSLFCAQKPHERALRRHVISCGIHTAAGCSWAQSWTFEESGENWGIHPYFTLCTEYTNDTHASTTGKLIHTDTLGKTGPRQRTSPSGIFRVAVFVTAKMCLAQVISVLIISIPFFLHESQRSFRASNAEFSATFPSSHHSLIG